jgi:DNA processing protein
VTDRDPKDRDPKDLDERGLALVTWSAIAEPGDPLAHAIVELLGAAEALEWVRGAAHDPVAATIALAPRAEPTLIDRAVDAVGRWVPRLGDGGAERHIDRAAKVGARVVPRGAPEWPDVLNDLGVGAPYCLWVRGPRSVREAFARAIAIVGSRSSTAYGEYVAAALSSGVVDEGWTVVSGGAYGIDARVHRAALAAGGVTVAVMAGGVDRLYPEGNADLLARVLETGAIVAEQPPGFPPHRSRFLTRNRIIAASAATVVVEAAHRSGALSTAHHAADLGRPVGAVPGPVTSASSSGCHRLLRNGAVCVTSAAEVLEMVQPLDASRADPEGPRPRVRARDFATAGERRAFDAVAARGSTIGEIGRVAGMTIAEVRCALGALELAGALRRDGDLWRRAPGKR